MNCVSFGEAVEALKLGKRVKRLYWEDFFVFQQVPAEINKDIIPKMQSLPQSVKAEFAKRGRDIRYLDQLAMVFKDNTITGWSPTAAETLADDWIIID